jgi:8-oxo-dGTP pyrophosphatase MutT (NUDIX family)
LPNRGIFVILRYLIEGVKNPERYANDRYDDAESPHISKVLNISRILRSHSKSATPTTMSYHQPSFIVAKVRGVAIKDGKVLLCKLAKAGFYCLPGGTLDPGETRLECLRREFIEELGTEPVVGKMIHTQEILKPDGITVLDFWYEILNADDFESVDLSACSHGFESEEVGFYDATLQGDFRPKDLFELAEGWGRKISG